MQKQNLLGRDNNDKAELWVYQFHPTSVHGESILEDVVILVVRIEDFGSQHELHEEIFERRHDSIRSRLPG